MEDATALLSLSGSIGGASTVGTGVLAIRFGARRWVVWPLLAVTILVAGLIVWSAINGGLWYAVPNSLLAVAMVALWDHHLATRQARPSRLALAFTAWRARRGVLRGPGGRRVRTIDQLRAEYGQSILDDATRDPILDHLLSTYERRIEAVASESGERLDAVSVTAFANRYLEMLSDPGRHLRSEPPYAGYSRHMLVIAATCRLADRFARVPAPTSRV
ncbi:hypothetical protein GCM10022251_37630 [Phytohabitans flavus]|uniref:Uncharacterized protein n=1 Tax=Phytohabitans flavus TaxID=1076124 RepID=A0A6F8XVN7_9ACTN|nr:hypothetical protein [Phytohabitans flavus]BCB77922.1 hypothetical protein Pflav_043320 [Phytohabitans flavus]